MYQELYSHIAKACCAITVIEDDEVVSEGTGFTINADGQILTAAHVALGQWPVDLKKYADRNTKIIAKLPGISEYECKLAICGLEIRVSAFSKPVWVDFAALVPSNALPAPVPFLKSRVLSPRLGEEVFLAGYSEELEIPFGVDKLLRSDVSGADDFYRAMSRGYLADMTGPLIKRGVIGNSRGIYAQDSASGKTISCEVIFVDNGMNPGASGGPVVNKVGEAIGIMTKRAITSAAQRADPSLAIPSGCTIAISLHPLLATSRDVP
jgi:hypothetical protein